VLRGLVIWCLAIACMAASLLASGSQPSPASQRAIVVIGDLHLGVGREAGQWHPFEDSRWREEFVRFMESVNADGAGATDLVINGDLFELLQSPTITCAHDEPRLGCTEDQARQRLEAVIAAHGDELRAIGHFARSGDNRVHLVVGDHDAALFFPSVGRRALEAIDGPSDRVAIVATAGWLSADDGVYVEHGHQAELSAARFSKWPNPLIAARGREHVERPWGEQVIQPFYDRTEARYPIVDNVAQEGVGAKYVLAAEHADPPVDMPAFLRFFLSKTTWQQFRMDLDDGDVQAPSWDIAQVRRDPASFLSAPLPADDPAAPLVAKATADGRLNAVVAAMSDTEITAVCDYRAAIRRARRRMERILTQLAGVGPPIAECPRLPDTVGSAFEYYWRSRDVLMSRHIETVRETLIREKRARGPFDIFVHGHTHLAERTFRPSGNTGPVVATSGAWQRTIHPVQLEQMAKERGIAMKELLSTLQPEDLAACYSFLRIPQDSSRARVPEGRAWRRAADGAWTMVAGCSGER
jgi:UDP-2,3-diacylglucosamine pyrophosphatase LpxH